VLIVFMSAITWLLQKAVGQRQLGRRALAAH
jgi:hypothetical protein